MLYLFMNLCYSNIVLCFGRSGDYVLNLIFPYFPMRSSPGLPSNRLQPETHLLEVAIKVLASQCGLHRTTIGEIAPRHPMGIEITNSELLMFGKYEYIYIYMDIPGY